MAWFSRMAFVILSPLFDFLEGSSSSESSKSDESKSSGGALTIGSMVTIRESSNKRVGTKEFRQESIMMKV